MGKKKERPKRDAPELRVGKITYLGDDSVAAKAIMEFMLLRRERREAGLEGEPQYPGVSHPQFR